MRVGRACCQILSRSSGASWEKRLNVCAWFCSSLRDEDDEVVMMHVISLNEILRQFFSMSLDEMYFVDERLSFFSFV